MKKSKSGTPYFLAILVLASIVLFSSYLTVMRYSDEFAKPKRTSFDYVEMPQRVMNAFNDVFVNNPEGEQALCVYGTISGDTARITDAIITASKPTEKGIMFRSCDNKYYQVWLRYIVGSSNLLGVVHNHPNKVCSMSDKDIYTFGNANWRLAGIICDENTIAFYNPKELDKVAEVRVV